MTSVGPPVAIFGPSPLLSITVEARGQAHDDIHLHAAGQGVWVARMAGELGATPVLCGFSGGETGMVLQPLLDALPGALRLVPTASASGSYVTDRRDGTRNVVASAFAVPPSRHEIDDLVSTTCATALDCELLVVCNPHPADALPLETYGSLVADVRGNGTPVLVDLSTPRLDSALTGGPDFVKLNDWELAEYACGPVSKPAELRAAAERLRAAGAGAVLVTRAGDPGLLLCDQGTFEVVPPRFEQGSREGCGDSMMGAIAAGWARGLPLPDAVTFGAAAGAANFLRHGLGTGTRAVVEELVDQVELRAG